MKKKQLPLHKKAELAMKKAVKKVLSQHKKEDRPIAIWEDGKVKMVFVKWMLYLNNPNMTNYRQIFWGIAQRF